jgi:hypothetical protein
MDVKAVKPLLGLSMTNELVATVDEHDCTRGSAKYLMARSRLFGTLDMSKTPHRLFQPKNLELVICG